MTHLLSNVEEGTGRSQLRCTEIRIEDGPVIESEKSNHEELLEFNT